MAPDAIFDLIFRGGGWAVAVILGFLLKQSWADRLTDAKAMIGLMTEVKQSNDAVAEVLHSRSGWAERSMIQSDQQHRENGTALAAHGGAIASLEGEIGELRRTVEEIRRRSP